MLGKINAEYALANINLNIRIWLYLWYFSPVKFILYAIKLNHSKLWLYVSETKKSVLQNSAYMMGQILF